MLLVSLLKVIGSIDGCGIILNLTQLLKINTKVKESLGDIVVKNIKSILLFRPKLLKSLKAYNRKLSKNKKTYFNTTATFKAYTPIIKTKGIRPYTVDLITHLKNLLVRFLIFRGHTGKII